jgi:hypothetical protein
MLALSFVGGAIGVVLFINVVPSAWLLLLVFYAGAVASFFAVIGASCLVFLRNQKRSGEAPRH